MSLSLSSRGRYQLLWCRFPCSKYNGASSAAISGKTFSTRRQLSKRGLKVEDVIWEAPRATAVSTICSISASFRLGMIGSRRRLVGTPASDSSFMAFNLFSGEGAPGSSFLLRAWLRVVTVKLATQRIFGSRSISWATRSDFVMICTRQSSREKSSRHARVNLSFASIGG